MASTPTDSATPGTSGDTNEKIFFPASVPTFALKALEPQPGGVWAVTDRNHDVFTFTYTVNGGETTYSVRIRPCMTEEAIRQHCHAFIYDTPQGGNETATRAPAKQPSDNSSQGQNFPLRPLRASFPAEHTENKAVATGLPAPQGSFVGHGGPLNEANQAVSGTSFDNTTVTQTFGIHTTPTTFGHNSEPSRSTDAIHTNVDWTTEIDAQSTAESSSSIAPDGLLGPTAQQTYMDDTWEPDTLTDWDMLFNTPNA